MHLLVRPLLFYLFTFAMDSFFHIFYFICVWCVCVCKSESMMSVFLEQSLKLKQKSLSILSSVPQQQIANTSLWPDFVWAMGTWTQALRFVCQKIIWLISPTLGYIFILSMVIFIYKSQACKTWWLRVTSGNF